HQFSLLSVSSSRCPRWYKPGVLLIGDAAHTMTPAAGAGIKYAIEDAVVAANLLAGPLAAGRLRLRDLAEVQQRREWPTRFIQAFGAFGLRLISGQLMKGRGTPALFARWAPLVFSLPFVGRLAAHLLAFGLWRVHVEDGHH